MFNIFFRRLEILTIKITCKSLLLCSLCSSTQSKGSFGTKSTFLECMDLRVSKVIQKAKIYFQILRVKNTVFILGHSILDHKVVKFANYAKITIKCDFFDGVEMRNKF